MTSTQLSSNAGRKHAQRKFKELKPCARCGGTKSLHRHHLDNDTTNNRKTNLAILCARCHGALHASERWKDHTKERICLYCGDQFTYERSREKTCSRSCGNKLAWMKRRMPRESPRA